MNLDISRMSFRPRNNRSGVVMQQGRVQLDADWNEWLAINDRRWRSETLDLMGRVRVAPPTPDAFKITVSGGALHIGRGRIYVDGLQAENHGLIPQSFDGVLSEETGTLPVPYFSQPYRPGLTAAPFPAGRHLAYLDVWSRTQTYLEDPDMVEIAVGVDTTARTQTIWQVKILQNIGTGTTCTTPDADIPGWLNIIRPSEGRLTTRNVLIPDPDDPCLLPPGAGYRGLENRTYRVEIHDQAADGTFRFKYSRINGIVASRVVTVDSATVLSVEAVIRDDVLRFKHGDWIEILDDRQELEGQPGLMRRVLDIDPATNRITLETALPAGAFPVDAQNRPNSAWHMRVRQWDQNGEVRDSSGALLADLTDPNSVGVIRLPALGTALRLEPGIDITFSLSDPAGRFKIGDYWLFTARTANAAIEELTNAPPHGIHHHYARLAIIESSGTAIIGTPTDCRPVDEEDECCCTIVVKPGENIQAAIDALPLTGGCICFKSGLHTFDDMLTLERGNIALIAEGPETILRRTRPGIVLTIGNPAGAAIERIRVHGLDFEGSASTTTNMREPLIIAAGAQDVRFEDVRFSGTLSPNSIPPYGLVMMNCSTVSVEKSTFSHVMLGLYMGEGCRTIDVLDNDFILSSKEFPIEALGGIFAEETTGRIRIEHNLITGGLSGIALNSIAFGKGSSRMGGSRIVGNQIGLAEAVAATAAGASADDLVGIDCGEDGCFIAENHVMYQHDRNVGIRGAGSHLTIADNICQCRVKELSSDLAIGIQIGIPDDTSDLFSANVTVRGNKLQGSQNGILCFQARDLHITHNHLDAGEERLGFGIAVTKSDGVTISDNIVRKAIVGAGASEGRGCTIDQNRLEECLMGVVLINEWAPSIRNNQINAPAFFGIGLLNGFLRCDITGNRIYNAGYAIDTAIGIGIYNLLGELVVERNEILNTGLAVDFKQRAAQALGLFGALVLESRISGNLISYAVTDLTLLDPAREDRAISMGGMLEYNVPFGAMDLSIGYGLHILGNKLMGPGKTALVEIFGFVIADAAAIRFERVTFNDNDCWHFCPPEMGDRKTAATISLSCRRAIVMGNHIKATTKGFPSVNYNTSSGTFIGNITTGGAINFVDFPNPQGSFNR
jgi:nitrous oxidase accessory protein NosD